MENPCSSPTPQCRKRPSPSLSGSPSPTPPPEPGRSTPRPPADGAAHLLHDDGRGLSFRPVFGGTTAQIWITGAPAPSIPADATPAEQEAHQAQLALRLAAGHRYNRAVTLLTEDDVDPSDLILDAVESHLLPAFTLKPHYVGHRLWDDLFAEALAEADDDTDTPAGTSFRDCGPEAHTGPETDAEPTPDPELETSTDPVTTSETEPSTEDPANAVSTPQQPADAAPTSEEPEVEEAATDSRPTTKRRPHRSARKSTPTTLS
ncbi:hypothetical protein ACFC0N_05700 [Streptomyces zaomyceticus]|uniref:hypothetical protein n=1 Tax=Streptomyces zaomyceticus TaxID=68286 RepID=UPI0035DF1E53